MPDMDVTHNQVAVADEGIPAILHCATVYRDTFTNDIVIANCQGCRLSPVFQIRGCFTNRAKLKNMVAGTNSGRTLDDNMRLDNRAFTYDDTRTNDRVRTNTDR